jgi:hypothetical protein
MSAEPALACCQDERDSRLRGQTPCQAIAPDAAAHRWCGMDRSRFGPRSRQLCPCWLPRITPPCRAGDMTAAGSCGRRRATSPAGLVRPSLRARKPSRRGAFGATASGSDLTSPVPDCGGSQAETGVWLEPVTLKGRDRQHACCTQDRIRTEPSRGGHQALKQPGVFVRGCYAGADERHSPLL